MKVDANSNAWVSCADWYNGMDFEGSAEEYDSTGSLVNTYKGGCPSQSQRVQRLASLRRRRRSGWQRRRLRRRYRYELVHG